jgi:hypothetical protein
MTRADVMLVAVTPFLARADDGPPPTSLHPRAAADSASVLVLIVLVPRPMLVVAALLATRAPGRRAHPVPRIVVTAVVA